MRPRVIVLAACLGVIVLVALTQTPARSKHVTPPSVTSVVRNELGQLQWVASEPTPLTAQEMAGRRVYLLGGCSYCHSQYDRPTTVDMRPWGPVSADARRWGPVAEPGEYAYDVPHLLGPGGIGPDLSREGLKYSDEWHLAHFWNPPLITQGSVMGGVSGLFDTPADPVSIVRGGASGNTLERTPVTEKLFAFGSDRQVKLTPNEQGLLFVPLVAQGQYPIIWTPNDEYTGTSVKLVVETPEIAALIAYVQKLGMNRGRWRELFEPDYVDGTDIVLPRSDERIAHGKQVYERRCIACHGPRGDGNGWAATFLYKQRPRNFTLGVFKFRLTKGVLPTDADLLRTISRGVRGTAMPAWFELPLDDRLAVIQYIKYALAVDRSDPKNPEYYFVEEQPGTPLHIGTPPPPTPALIAHGQQVWRQAKCWECHGNAGRGDGEKALGLKDDWGFPIRPANLTIGQFKSGPAVTDIFRTISTGLSGTPMPGFQDAFVEADRWALAYYILSLSAFTDPLTAAALPIDAADRAALDDARLNTPSPEHAYRLRPPAAGTEE